MTTDKTTRPAMPRTLADAQEALAAVRPPQAAPLSERLAYHSAQPRYTPKSQKLIEVIITRRCSWPSRNGNARRRSKPRCPPSGRPMKASREK